jgi:hypothetical protein
MIKLVLIKVVTTGETNFPHREIITGLGRIFRLCVVQIIPLTSLLNTAQWIILLHKIYVIHSFLFTFPYCSPLFLVAFRYVHVFYLKRVFNLIPCVPSNA